MSKHVIFVLIAGLLLLTVVGFSDTEDTAEAALTLTSVIDVTIDDSLLAGISVGQDSSSGADYNLEDLFGTADPIVVAFGGTFTVKIIALTKFAVGINYTASSTLITPIEFSHPDAVLVLTDGTGAYWSGSLATSYIPYSAGVSTILSISDDFDCVNNTPGESEDYDLSVNLDELGDREAGEVITFTAKVWVWDSTT
ncbi:MAG: hypothetical protein KAU10_07230 [Dehalococcoidia bacterium]|nr:hypothetical protein [Dehalococcoidia bacterium]